MSDSRFSVWVHVEEETPDGEYVDWSWDLEGAAVAKFDTLADAVAFGNWLQRYALRREPHKQTPVEHSPMFKVVGGYMVSVGLCECGKVLGHE